MNNYLNVAEVVSAAQLLQSHYAQQLEFSALSAVSYEGRPIQALRVHEAGGAAGKPVFMVIGGQHGCEWGSCEIILNLAEDLVRGTDEGLDYGQRQFSASQMQALMAAMDFVLVPLVNPDGRYHSQTVRGEGEWRKNRSLTQASEDPRSIGVDLNRNFDIVFDMATLHPPGAVVAASTRPIDSQYQGTRPFCEPESDYVRSLVESLPTLRWFVDLHSGARAVLYPWSLDDAQTADAQMNFANAAFDGQRGKFADSYGEYMPADDLAEHQRLAKIAADELSRLTAEVYNAEAGFDFTGACGSSHDWVYSRGRVPGSTAPSTLAFAIEWHELFAPPWSLMESLVADVGASLILMARAAAGLR